MYLRFNDKFDDFAIDIDYLLPKFLRMLGIELNEENYLKIFLDVNKKMPDFTNDEWDLFMHHLVEKQIIQIVSFD